MLVTSSRPTMGPLTSSASSPTSHHVHQHHPADLSPRSSNSSLMSSNESLLNTSLSMPSPGTRENVISPRGSAVGLGEVSPLQCLQNAFSNGRSTFSMFHEGDNEQLEQQIKSFGMMASPVAGDSPGMKCESDEEMHEHDEHGMTRTPSGSPGSTSNGNNLNSGQSTIFQCPLCTIICNSRHDFNEHLVTHSAQHACPRCDYIAGTEDELRDHAQETHGVDDFMESLSDDEVKTPKTNAQGKLKTFKCKHCEYRAVTKKEFWDHTKSHIREDKMLHCPKCPFITEYKHHLEYHLRNHMNSKPYQCGKCPYSCVNKSMLNSHLKSHSNVYQYRCSDCSYATKYCHSLKLHLRKYNHNPAMVLNPDGTPNPLPIIDVYGTRRGPKIKRPDPILEGLATTTPALPCSPNHINNNNNNKPAKTPKKLTTPVRKEKAAKPRQQRHEPKDLSPKHASSPRYISSMPGQVVTPPLKKMKDDSSGDSDSEMRLQSSKAYFQSMGRATQLPQAPISPSSIAMILQQANNGMPEHHHSRKEANFPLSSPPNTLQQIYSAAVNQYLMNPALNGTASLNDLAKQMSNDQQAKMLAQFLQSRLLYTQQWQQQHMPANLRGNGHDHELDGNDNSIPAHCPLDLRNPKNDGMMTTNDEIKRRKRKGKASRYERMCSSEDEDEALDFSYNNNNNEYKENKKRKHDSPTDLSVPLNNLLCKYCEINFPDRELYAIHMNFHSGDVEPFLCRSCGKKTRDKVEFSRHLFTDPH